MADTIYTVKPGDNLTKIAREYGVTIKRIVAANLIVTDPNLIKAGWQLRIPATWQNPKVNARYGGAKDGGNGKCQLLTEFELPEAAYADGWNRYDATSEGVTYDDSFDQPDRTGTKGSFTVHAVVKFFELAARPDWDATEGPSTTTTMSITRWLP